MSMHLRGSRDMMGRDEEGWWKSRTGLEQKLLILSTLLFILAFGLMITVIVLKNRSTPGPEVTTLSPTEVTSNTTDVTETTTEEMATSTDPTATSADPTVTSTDPTAVPTESTAAPTELTAAPTESTAAPTETAATETTKTTPKDKEPVNPSKLNEVESNNSVPKPEKIGA